MDNVQDAHSGCQLLANEFCGHTGCRRPEPKVSRMRYFQASSKLRACHRFVPPVVIRASTWAFTFSTPASANTTGVASEGVAPD